MNIIEGIIEIIEQKKNVGSVVYQQTKNEFSFLTVLREPLNNHSKTDRIITDSNISIQDAAIKMFLKLKDFGI